jgi:putative ABC transport system permease protein
MMVSVGIMVGSFRETVSVWTAQQLRADLYLRPAGGGSAGRQTLMDARIADDLERLPSVLAVDRFRLYDISYRDTPALLGAGQTEVFSAHGSIALLPGPDRRAVLAKLPRGDYAIVSEPFANKHGAAVGDRIRLPVGAGVAFEVLAIYADYSNERGYVIVDRETLLRHLPDPAVSSLAVYLRNGVDPAEARNEVERVVRGRSVVVASNRDLRENAMRIFDRTFAITWALEAVAILVAVLGIAGALLRRRSAACCCARPGCSACSPTPRGSCSGGFSRCC